jgi:hypothetical protein
LSKQAVPIGTDDDRKEHKMRNTSLTLSLALMLAASGVFAQQAPTGPARTEPGGSPFTYEALGATPSVRLPRWLTRDEAKATHETSAPSTPRAPAAAARPDAGKTAEVAAPAATSMH